jgi:hypothetical protein
VVLMQVDPDSGAVSTRVAIRQPWLQVSGWALPQLPPLITDILISLDDRWLFFSNWLQGACASALCCAVLCCAVLCCAVLCCAVLCCAVLCCAVLASRWLSAARVLPRPRSMRRHRAAGAARRCRRPPRAGDVCMYDISNPAEPRLACRLWLGGSIARGGAVSVPRDALATLGLAEPPARPVVRGVAVQGGPQMLQLSLDGRRLYITNSLLSPWDKQFYPDMVEKVCGAVGLWVRAWVGRGGRLPRLHLSTLVRFWSVGDVRHTLLSVAVMRHTHTCQHAQGGQLVVADVDMQAGTMTLNQDFVVSRAHTHRGGGGGRGGACAARLAGSGALHTAGLPAPRVCVWRRARPVCPAACARAMLLPPARRRLTLARSRTGPCSRTSAATRAATAAATSGCELLARDQPACQRLWQRPHGAPRLCD